MCFRYNKGNVHVMCSNLLQFTQRPVVCFESKGLNCVVNTYFSCTVYMVCTFSVFLG